MNWQPNQQGLAQILKLIYDSRTSDNQVQKAIHQQLDSLSNNVADFNNYLVFILTHMKDQPEEVRQVAGLFLKANLRLPEVMQKIDPGALEHIKNSLLMGMGDSSRHIRSTIGTVITTIVTHKGLTSWPNIIPGLVQLLDNKENQHIVEGAMNALYKICEDSAEQLGSPELGKPLTYLIPKLVAMLSFPVENVRREALCALLQFLPAMPEAMLNNMEPFMRGLFAVATDPSKEIRRKVCSCFVALLERPEFLQGSMTAVLEYMLQCTQDEDDTLALDACEFWSTIAESEYCYNTLKDILPRLIPVLLNGMVYSQIDQIIMGAEEETQSTNVPDQQHQIKPSKYFHHAKTHTHEHEDVPDQLDNKGFDEDQDDEDYDDEDDEDDDLDEVTEWSLRKCSASSLDCLSTVFKEQILPVLLPAIQAKLAPTNKWDVRESAILALGAIAEGCFESMKQHLAQLLPFLLQQLNDPKPLLRSITCWTISRYSKWVVSENMLGPVVSELLKRILDDNKPVQQAACSAFATLEEEAGNELAPYLEPILLTMVAAFSKYQTKNLLILYDAIGTLADVVGHNLNQPKYIQILMPPLIEKWNLLPDTDKNLFPLLECLTSVAEALGVGFQGFVAPVYQRCLRLIESTLTAQKVAEENNDDAPDKEAIVCAIDLLSGLTEGLGTGFESLVAGSNLLSLLYTCMQDEASDVRQCAFAFVGDLAKTCIHHLRPVLPQYVQILVQNLKSTFIAVCNNAIWALGEIAIKIGAQEFNKNGDYITTIISILIPLLNTPNLNRGLLENTAITLGRMGLVAPEIVAPQIQHFVHNWCLALRSIRNDIEKEHAFKGLCCMIRHNPQGVFENFAYVCDAISCWNNPNQELRQEFFQILHGFKNSIGDTNWKNYYDQFPKTLREKLTAMYNL